MCLRMDSCMVAFSRLVLTPAVLLFLVVSLSQKRPLREVGNLFSFMPSKKTRCVDCTERDVTHDILTPVNEMKRLFYRWWLGNTRIKSECSIAGVDLPIITTCNRPYPRILESLTICRCNYKGSTFSSDPECWSGRSWTHDLPRYSPVIPTLVRVFSLSLCGPNSIVGLTLWRRANPRNVGF